MLHSYGYKPAPVFGWHREAAERAARALTFGVEVEVEPVDGVRLTCSTETATDRVDEMGDGRVYCKSDSSLREGGFEIVSHPGTLAHHMYGMHWKGILRRAQKAGRRSHDARNCGLHVHIGRAEMGASDAERDRVIRMMQVIVMRYRSEWAQFARRSANTRYAPIPNEADARSDSVDVLREFGRRLDTYTAYHMERYTAVNVNNTATVEIRIFKGTLLRDTLIATIQACENLTTWCMAHDWSDIPGSTFADIVCHVPHREVVGYMQNRNLLPRDVTVLPGGTRIPDFTTGRA